MAFATITKGFNDLENQDTSHRIRQKDGGRKKKILLDPTLVKDVQEIVEASTMGSPKSTLLWCSKSVRNSANALNSRSPRRINHANALNSRSPRRINHALIPRMLDNQGYSLQGNRKRECWEMEKF
jgi:hypothetical protein